MISENIPQMELYADYPRSLLRMRLPFNQPGSSDTVPGRFREIVRRFPQHPAVVTPEKVLTYQELDRCSDALAAAIVDQSAFSSQPVALLVPDGVEAVTAILAVLKAGRCYLPLSLDWPKIRLDRILADSAAQQIITTKTHQELVAALPNQQPQVLLLQEANSDTSRPVTRDDLTIESFGVVFFTSGSTGQPKGVIRTHHYFLETAWEAYHYGSVTPLDRIAYISSHVYAGSMLDIFYGLLNGATLFHYPFKQHHIQELIQWLQDQRITIFHPPVSLFRDLMGALGPADDLSRVRLLVLGGQTVRHADVEHFKSRFADQALLLVRYAATETGNITLFQIDKETEFDTETVPVGYTRPTVEVMILDDHHHRLPNSVIGEIAVRSPGLSPGYLGQPALTAAKFIPDLERGDRIYLTGDLGRLHEDGLLEHLGRKDTAVKIRGYFVSPNSVETALLQIPGVGDAVVIANQGTDGDNQLTAFMVAQEHTELSVSQVRASLSAVLPSYMVPARFAVLDQLPRLTNGKIDRQALPNIGSTRPTLDVAYVPPRTPFEEQLERIWAEVLEIEQVGIYDNFLDLGGHSLQATRIVSHVTAKLRVDIPVRVLFEAATIEEMAMAILKHQAEQLDDNELESLLAETAILFDHETEAAPKVDQ